MNDLMDLRLHHHITQEIYRQQMLQRLPGKILTFYRQNPLSQAWLFTSSINFIQHNFCTKLT